MAEINLEPYTETYTDLPLTKFPVSEDEWNRMSDVSASMMSLVQEYNKLYADGRYTDAKQMIDNNEQLLNCFFNADKYNQLRDATIAMQRFLLNEVAALVKEVAKNTVGIEDQPTDEQKSQVTYSAKRIDELFALLENSHFTKKQVVVPSSGWSSAYPFENTVSVDGITSDMEMRVVGTVIPTGTDLTTVKGIIKAAGFLISTPDGIKDGAITFRAYKKPSVDFTVDIEGG